MELYTWNAVRRLEDTEMGLEGRKGPEFSDGLHEL